MGRTLNLTDKEADDLLFWVTSLLRSDRHADDLQPIALKLDPQEGAKAVRVNKELREEVTDDA